MKYYKITYQGIHSNIINFLISRFSNLSYFKKNFINFYLKIEIDEENLIDALKSYRDLTIKELKSKPRPEKLWKGFWVTIDQQKEKQIKSNLVKF